MSELRVVVGDKLISARVRNRIVLRNGVHHVEATYDYGNTWASEARFTDRLEAEKTKKCWDRFYKLEVVATGGKP